ncbi:PH domain-containing protein [Metabacillus malikii]|uniref:Membrane protein YdbS with pleckstrin-like domain n=1 Tax=Metabacillus malikii TaxID=1504265 RepID=A0ABT9ZAJ4_9BACI|nr:PH domain-containing protein [Metabacillus malikii]MDQ0228964.1 membrane protein YdbS with pleckstrin-like domain [Metabacillus malikii]
METMISSPKRKLSKDAVKVWIMKDFITDIIGLIVLAVLFFLDYLFTWPYWIEWIIIGFIILSLLSPVWSIIRSNLLYKNWRYDIDEEFLKLRFGSLIEEHQLVPMTKVQSVTTSQGPLYRRYGLYILKIETMGSIHTIPGLSKQVAFDLRNTIAHYAKIKEVE